jgi:hypothetical protein
MATRVRIYEQPKSAMQSGRAGTTEWVLEFEPTEPARADPLMGWIGGGNTQAQVKLRFESREEALAFAAREGFSAQVELPHTKKFVPKSYADNFRFGRTDNWTH